jgi:hypothetical protein
LTPGLARDVQGCVGPSEALPLMVGDRVSMQTAGRSPSHDKPTLPLANRLAGKEGTDLVSDELRVVTSCEAIEIAKISRGLSVKTPAAFCNANRPMTGESRVTVAVRRGPFSLPVISVACERWRDPCHLTGVPRNLCVCVTGRPRGT